MKIIAILPKSPHPEGRRGVLLKQDWFRQCELAVDMWNDDDSIVVASALQIKGADPEREYYSEALAYKFRGRKIKKCYDVATIINEGVETVGQIEAMYKFAKTQEGEFVMIVTFSHYPRVAWICRRHGINCQLKVAWGIPRTRELFTDAILTIAYPILDLLELEPWFIRKVTERRLRGEF